MGINGQNRHTSYTRSLAEWRARDQAGVERGLWRLEMFWSAPPQTGLSGSRISTMSNEFLNCSISRLNINPHGAFILIHGYDIQ